MAEYAIASVVFVDDPLKIIHGVLIIGRTERTHARVLPRHSEFVVVVESAMNVRLSDNGLSV